MLIRLAPGLNGWEGHREALRWHTKEFIEITAKYQPAYIERCFSSMAGLHEFSVAFYKDVGNLYDALTRLKNLGRNPTGFSIDDAPILGLLVRIAKLVKDVVRYYEQPRLSVGSLCPSSFSAPRLRLRPRPARSSAP